MEKKEQDYLTETSIIDKKDKQKKDDLEESLELFEEDKTLDDLEEDITHEIKISKDTSNNILKISRMIKESVLTIGGYEEQPTSGDKSVFKLTKEPMASTEIIKGFEGILKPYADESNMVSKKKWDSFVVQARADWGAFYKLCLREKASPESKERTVQRIFQSCLINIGEITSDNPENMGTLFGNINKNIEEDDARKMFGAK